MSLSKLDILAHRIQGSKLPVGGPSLERGDGGGTQLTANLDKKREERGSQEQGCRVTQGPESSLCIGLFGVRGFRVFSRHRKCGRIALFL